MPPRDATGTHPAVVVAMLAIAGLGGYGYYQHERRLDRIAERSWELQEEFRWHQLQEASESVVLTPSPILDALADWMAQRNSLAVFDAVRRNELQSRYGFTTMELVTIATTLTDLDRVAERAEQWDQTMEARRRESWEADGLEYEDPRTVVARMRAVEAALRRGDHVGAQIALHRNWEPPARDED